MRFKYLPVSALAATLLIGAPGLAVAQNTTTPANPPAAAAPGPVTPGPVTNSRGGGGLWGLVGLVGLLGLGGWRSRNRALPPTTGVGTGTTNRL